MQTFNHVAGGVAFTGLFCSFSDINIFERPEYIGATIFFSILPDIDHTKSIIGKAFYPVSKFLHRKFGHRTITHSLLFYLYLSFCIFWIDELLHSKNFVFLHIYLFSFGSHLIFDMCTKQGVPLFYPTSRRACVLPANPNMRLSSSDIKAEAVIFIVFLSLTWFSYPLFSRGFWATYNKAFLTKKHIQNEAKRNPNKMRLTLQNRADSTLISGFLVSFTENKILLYDKKFIELDEEKHIFKDFKHENQPFRFQNLRLKNISEDSVKRLFPNPYLSFDIQSNQNINYFEGAILSNAKVVKLKNITDFQFYLDEIDNSETEQKIAFLEGEIFDEISEFEEQKNEKKKLENEIQEIKSSYEKLTDWKKTNSLKVLKAKELDLENFVLKKPGTQAKNNELKALKNSLKKKEITFNVNAILLE